MDSSARRKHTLTKATTGLGAELTEGTALWEVLRFPELERALRSTLGGVVVERLDAPSPRPDGRVLSISVNAVRSRHGFQGAVALISDVTAVRKVEQMRIDFVAKRDPGGGIAFDFAQDGEGRINSLLRFRRLAETAQGIG